VHAEDVNATCCTRQSDMLEGAALLADATAVVMANDVLALQAGQLNITKLMSATETAIKGGDAKNGGLGMRAGRGEVLCWVTGRRPG